MEVESAQPAGYIHYFANEKKTRLGAHLESAGVQTSGVDAAGGDFSFVKTLGAHGVKSEGMQFPLTGLQGRIAPALRRCGLREKCRQSLWKEVAQSLPESGAVAPSARLLQLAEHAGMGAGVGSQVENKGIARAPVRLGLQNCRAAQATMRHEHFFPKGLWLETAHAPCSFRAHDWRVFG